MRLDAWKWTWDVPNGTWPQANVWPGQHWVWEVREVAVVTIRRDYPRSAGQSPGNFQGHRKTQVGWARTKAWSLPVASHALTESELKEAWGPRG